MPIGRKNQDIQRLRAIAALAVLVGHVPWLQVGLSRLFHFQIDPRTGVDLFFVISGFVVSAAFERDLARDAPPARSALRAFYTKRAARILPTAYLSLALWWIGATWLNRSGAWGPPLTGAPAIAALASGVFMVWNYTEVLAGVTMPLFWYWTLCVEEHFYLLYPVFRLVAGTTGRRIAVAIATVAGVHAARFWMDDPRALESLSHARFDQLALGVLIGLAWNRWPARAAIAAARLREPGALRHLGIAAIVLVLIGLGLLPVTLLVGEAAWEPRAGYALAGVCAAAVVALASADADLLASGRSTGRWLSALGERSYGIYMFHVPALWLVVEARFRLFARPDAAWLRAPEMIAYMAVLAGLVEANYRWVEQPLIAWSHRRR